MRSTHRRVPLLLVILASFALVAAACGDDDSAGGTTASGSTASASSSDSETSGGEAEFVCPDAADEPVADGSINISGSSTVAPITLQAADCFADAGGTQDITVDNPGTGDGFQVFCTGETDVSNASRRIRDDENEAGKCAANGIEFIEIKVGFDGIAVMTNSANETVECLSFADLYAIVGPESQDFANWKDAEVLAGELGSTLTYPDLELVITAPGEESGTYDSFIEIALGDPADARVEAGAITEDEAGTTRPFPGQSNDDNIIQGIEGAEGAFGWVGFAFADQAGEDVKIVDISEEPGGTCIAPTPETIADGSYPVSRSLYIYVDKAKAESNAALASFIDYYLAGLSEIVEGADYVPLPADQTQASIDRWEARTTGIGT